MVFTGNLFRVTTRASHYYFWYGGFAAHIYNKHWNPIYICMYFLVTGFIYRYLPTAIMPTFSLAAPEVVVVTTTSGVASDKVGIITTTEKVGIITIIELQQCRKGPNVISSSCYTGLWLGHARFGKLSAVWFYHTQRDRQLSRCIGTPGDLVDKNYTTV